MEREKNKNIGSVVAIVILVILVITLGGYIGYDKALNKDSANNNEKDSIKTRACTGTYIGTAALTQDFVTGEYGKGTLTIELRNDGTYKLTKENIIDGATGEYTIIDNTLLLKTEPEICGPDMECNASYTETLQISEDCSTISEGYGSYFFDSDFTLTKQK